MLLFAFAACPNLCLMDLLLQGQETCFNLCHARVTVARGRESVVNTDYGVHHNWVNVIGQKHSFAARPCFLVAMPSVVSMTTIDTGVILGSNSHNIKQWQKSTSEFIPE